MCVEIAIGLPVYERQHGRLGDAAKQRHSRLGDAALRLGPYDYGVTI
jgi:hypothetical protein